MLERGVIVCLGTDSLASSPTLGVLDEVRFLHRRDPSLSGPLLLTMATLFGAWALRIDDVAGSLKPGKSADLAVVALPDRDEADPHDLLLDGDGPVVATMFDGGSSRDAVVGSAMRTVFGRGPRHRKTVRMADPTRTALRRGRRGRPRGSARRCRGSRRRRRRAGG